MTPGFFIHQATALAEGVRALRLGRTAWDTALARWRWVKMFSGHVERTWENRREMMFLWDLSDFTGFSAIYPPEICYKMVISMDLQGFTHSINGIYPLVICSSLLLNMAQSKVSFAMFSQ